MSFGLEFYLPPGKLDGKGEWVLDACPGCGKAEKAYFNPHKGVGVCFACDLVIKNEAHLLEICGGEARRVELDRAPTVTGGQYIDPPRWCMHAWDVDEARNFLLSRGIEERTARTVPVWWAPDRPGIAVQLDPLSREFPEEAFAVRYAPMRKNKWMSPGVKASGYAFGLRAWLASGRRRLLVVEGIFDLLATGLYGWGVANLGTTIRETLCIRLARLRDRARPEVVVWYDHKEDDWKKAQDTIHRLKLWGIPAHGIRSEADPKHYRAEELSWLREWLEA